MRISSRRLMAAAIVTAALPLALLAVPGSAGASVAPSPKSCTANHCSGLDPTLSYLFGSKPRAYCNAGAQSVGVVLHPFGGTLRLRWGPNCQTNWVWFTPANNDTYEMGLYGTDLSGNETAYAGDGLDHDYVFSGKGVTHYSDQVWSPGPADPCIADRTADSPEACFPDIQTGS